MPLLNSRYSILATTPSFRAGQSLVEILVAVGVGVILVVGALAMIAPTLRTSGDVTRMQAASAAGKELLDAAHALGEQNWHALNSLSTTSANRYYVIASTSPFVVATGTESMLIATTTYTRYFYVDNVYRNASGRIDTSGAYDPSTKKITVVYAFASTTASFTSYLARTASELFSQGDWSGGAGQEGPVTVTTTNARFSSSSGIDVTTSTGAIVIQGF